jgi:hypothetical protein
VKKLVAVPGALALLASTAALAAAASTTMSFVSVNGPMKTTKRGFVQTNGDFVGKKKVGTDRLSCTLTDQSHAKCLVTVIRPKGTLRAAVSLAGSTSSGTFKIVGGTGVYRGATGSGTYKNANTSGTKTAITINLK